MMGGEFSPRGEQLENVPLKVEGLFRGLKDSDKRVEVGSKSNT